MLSIYRINTWAMQNKLQWVLLQFQWCKVNCFFVLCSISIIFYTDNIISTWVSLFENTHWSMCTAWVGATSLRLCVCLSLFSSSIKLITNGKVTNNLSRSVGVISYRMFSGFTGSVNLALRRSIVDSFSLILITLKSSTQQGNALSFKMKKELAKPPAVGSNF